MRSKRIPVLFLAFLMATEGWGCASENNIQSEDTTEETYETEPSVDDESRENTALFTEENISKGLLHKTVYALVSAAENSTLEYWNEYGYIEDIGDGRGYTAGLVGFTSGTGDLLEVVKLYTRLAPDNGLAAYIPALEKVNGSDSHQNLGEGFCQAWKEAAKTAAMMQAQNEIINEEYMDPAIEAAAQDGLSPLGQYIYYDALIVHVDGDDPQSFGAIRNEAKKKAKTPTQGGNETTYLNAFLDARIPVMKAETAHSDLSRIDVQREFLKEKKFDLSLPLSFTMYGDFYDLTSQVLAKAPDNF